MTDRALVDANEMNVSVNVRARPPAGLDRQLRFDDAERSFVYAVGRRYVADEDAADDVAQEAMLLAFRHRALFRGEAHPRTWLYRIAAMAALGYLRRQHRREARVVGCDPAQLAGFEDPATPSAEDALVRHQLADRLHGQLRALDEKYAAVLRLRAEGVGEHEIAERLGLSVGVVKGRAFRARGMLRDALLAEAPAGDEVSAPPARGWRRSPRARACSRSTPQTGSRRAA